MGSNRLPSSCPEAVGILVPPLSFSFPSALMGDKCHSDALQGSLTLRVHVPLQGQLEPGGSSLIIVRAPSQLSPSQDAPQQSPVPSSHRSPPITGTRFLHGLCWYTDSLAQAPHHLVAGQGLTCPLGPPPVLHPPPPLRHPKDPCGSQPWEHGAWGAVVRGSARHTLSVPYRGPSGGGCNPAKPCGVPASSW